MEKFLNESDYLNQAQAQNQLRDQMLSYLSQVIDRIKNDNHGNFKALRMDTFWGTFIDCLVVQTSNALAHAALENPKIDLDMLCHAIFEDIRLTSALAKAQIEKNNLQRKGK